MGHEEECKIIMPKEGADTITIKLKIAIALKLFIVFLLVLIVYVSLYASMYLGAYFAPYELLTLYILRLRYCFRLSIRK